MGWLEAFFVALMDLSDVVLPRAPASLSSAKAIPPSPELAQGLLETRTES
jgi:hypothetical protein